MNEENKIASHLIAQKFKVETLGNNASGVEMIRVEPNDLPAIAKELQKAKKFTILNFMTALEVKFGYQVVIQLENHDDMSAVVLKVIVDKTNPVIPSLTDLYPTADWQEREAYDMLGIKFEGHPNLTRILNPDDWQGFPLRKDYIGPIDELSQPVKLSLKK